jgi:hypothetical protein
MWKNDLPFENEAYRDVREGLNGLLRMSNATSPLQFACIFVHHMRRGHLESTDRVRQLPEGKLKRELIHVRSMATSRLLRFLFKEGATGVFISVVLFFAGLISRANAIRSGALQTADRLLQDFRDCGQPPLSSQT